MSKLHVTKFSGLNPLFEDDYEMFAKGLGITDGGIQYIIQEARANRSYILTSVDEQNADEGYLARSESLDVYWRKPIAGMDFLSKLDAANIFLAWLNVGKVLLTYPLLTRKRTSYLDLNYLICHV